MTETSPPSADLRARLANIRRFDQLIVFLRDELDWPVGRADFEDLTFEYTADELGLDPRNEAKVQEIKRLRPLVAGQPWGIFFVKFQPKRLPVVALRRILAGVAIKKRGSANAAERRSWADDDLLFVSNYGEGDQRRIAFAHFTAPEARGRLPTLKVLGWDNLDTQLHLNDVAQKLVAHLAWPDEPDDTDAWREQWRAAFRLRHGEVIATSKKLSARLAELARAIRDRTATALAIESAAGPLTQLMKALRAALVDDLDEDRFADMYAQTIAYGLLSARIADPKRKTTDGLATHLRTNPFLRELMRAFFRAGGRRDAAAVGIDFDELGVSEVVELLDAANMEAVLRDFGDRNPQEDPVIHFYEHFLAAYDREQKVKRGVFYTPRPVVSYIVRSVDEELKSEFALADGLADTTTWAEMADRHEGLRIPEGTPPDQAFVQILDPATGTGTFLVEAIDLIHRTMKSKWRAQGWGDHEISTQWNEYVPKHLLPRLHGYELLMAPYAIAHLKVGLKLHETGYRLQGHDRAPRAQIYLTNALEPPAPDSQLQLDILPAIAGEAEAVSTVKRDQRFTVVMGNPPYGEAGRGGEWIASLVRGQGLPTGRKTLSYFEVNGKPLGERNPQWLNDLYVRFTRLSQHLIELAGAGVHGFITNHSYIDNPTFRGMRWALLEAFNSLSVVDLHGNRRKKEVALDGSVDDNVFDIEQGVAIGVFVRSGAGRRAAIGTPGHTRVRHLDLWGLRSHKYGQLVTNPSTETAWAPIAPRPDLYVLRPFERAGEYEGWPSIKAIMPCNGIGMTTARDSFVIDFDQLPLVERAREFRDATESDEDLCRRLKIPLKKGWNVAKSRRQIRDAGRLAGHVKPVLYRPFDRRLIFYHDSLVWRTAKRIMGQMLEGRNVGIITTRQTKDPWGAAAASCMIGHKTCSAYDSNYLFPLYLYPNVGRSGDLPLNPWSKGKDGRQPNLDEAFVGRLAATELRFVPDGHGDLHFTFGPEDVLDYIYAVFHSPGYRGRYEPHLKLDFPRVPIPGGTSLFRRLARVGRDLLALHLLESRALDHPLTDYAGPRSLMVGRVGWSNGTVWLDAGRTSNARAGHRALEPGRYGFHGVPEQVWDFRIGGYQVCHKWLKDRKGRQLSDDDISHYQKIVVALSETIRIMVEIDQVIEECGGWPGAFRPGGQPDVRRQASPPLAAEPRPLYDTGPTKRDSDR